MGPVVFNNFPPNDLDINKETSFYRQSLNENVFR